MPRPADRKGPAPALVALPLALMKESMDDEDPDEADQRGQKRRDQEVEDGPEGDHPTHFGVEAGQASDEAGDD